MHFLAGLALGVLLLAAPANAQTPQTHDEMKKAVVVKRFPDGRVVASSATFAVVERTRRYSNGGLGYHRVSLMIEAWPDKPVEIYFLATSVDALFPTEKHAQDEPADPTRILEGHVGPPWKETSSRLLENTVTCEGDGNWCQWTRHRRVNLTQDIVADEKRKSISMGITYANAGWTIPRSHLVATLDAIGLLHAFK